MKGSRREKSTMRRDPQIWHKRGCGGREPYGNIVIFARAAVNSKLEGNGRSLRVILQPGSRGQLRNDDEEEEVDREGGREGSGDEPASYLASWN